MSIRWPTQLALGACVLVGAAGGCSSEGGADQARSREPTETLSQAATAPAPTVFDPGPRPGAAGAGAPAAAQPVQPDDAASQQAASAGCFPGLGAAALRACEQAILRFQEVDSVSGKLPNETGTGLGPTFNGNSCAMCHAQPAILGSSPGLTSPQNPVPNPQVALATLDGAKNAVPPFITASGPVREVRFTSDGGVHDLFTIAGRSDAPGCNAQQPDFTGASSFRIPTPLFGLGLVENTSEATLQANLAASAGGGTGGRFNLSGNDGTITRFGWKAQNKSILIFVAEAYNVEQGVTNEGFPDERTGGASNLAGCLALNPTPEDATNLGGSGANTVSDVSSDTVNFAIASRLSRPPTPASPPFKIGGTTIPPGQVSRGSQQFVAIGCASCHTPSLTTAASSIDPAMSGVTFQPYSDFALHHMGAGLSDGISQGVAGPDEFRTAPLWGVGQRLFFLHDGRASDLLSAIAAHGGDAAGVVAAFNQLNKQDQQDIVFFLRSL